MFGKKLYKYFIAYEMVSYDGRKMMSNTDVNLRRKITSLKDITTIELFLASIVGAKYVTVVNYQLMGASKNYEPTIM